MTENPLSAHMPTVPADISDSLQNEYGELESRFARGDWGPAELNGGRYAEAVLRYLEWKRSNSYTPFGKQLDRMGIINGVTNDASLAEGIRFHVRRCADLLLDVRNKRDVAHPGVTIDVREMDSKLVMRLASWSLAEIIREESGLPVSDVQQLVDRLSATQFPLVEEIGGELVVVAKNLTTREQALVALYHAFPDPVPLQHLQRAVKYKRAPRFKQMMQEEDSKGVVHFQDDLVYLTRARGVPWVEKNIDLQVRL